MRNFIEQKRILIEQALQKEIAWTTVVFLFAMNGIYVYYSVNKIRILGLESNFFALVMTVLTLGSLYGTIANFLYGYFLKVSSSLFGSKATLKKIYKAQELAFKPFIWFFFIILFELFIFNFYEDKIIQERRKLVDFIFSFLQLFKVLLAVWTILLLFNSLKIALELPWKQSLLSFLIAGLAFSPFYYLLLIKLK